MDTILSEDARTATTPFPCGRCFNCKINKSREWTNRLLLENMASADSKFITLTYNDDHLPKDQSLKPNHLKNFIQTYRRKHVPGQKIRYFAVGEYGDKTWRPHYHLAVFSDGRLWNQVESSNGRFTVGLTWPRGYSDVGDITKDSARYITGYVTKKVTKPYYTQLGNRHPEFMRCSKQGGGIGIGAIRQIAQKLKSSPHFDPRIIREIKIGNQTLPLGRYLTEKLSSEIGITENQKRIALQEYQFEILEDHIDSDNFLASLLDSKETKRISREKKYQIFSKRKSL